jgi:1,4-alpha-glucan branching enzyme
MSYGLRAIAGVALLLLAFAGSGCSIFAFIEDRLPPPQSTEHGIRFRYKAPAARQVNLAGEFNNWLGTANGGRLDPNIDSMKDLDDDGVWEVTLPLPPGRYQYKYVVDQVDWQEDPGNPETTDDGYGGKNSILVVASDVKYQYSESYLSYSLDTGSRSRRTLDFQFTLSGYPEALEVYVTGDFADWDPRAHPMTLSADGTWQATLPLTEGDHAYKFVVDGAWLADPANPETVDDGQGGVNSLARVRP